MSNVRATLAIQYFHSEEDERSVFSKIRAYVAQLDSGGSTLYRGCYEVAIDQRQQRATHGRE